MVQVPAISVTNPDLESEFLSFNSPATPSVPDSPTVFDVINNLGDLDSNDLVDDWNLSEETPSPEDDVNPDNRTKSLASDPASLDNPIDSSSSLSANPSWPPLFTSIPEFYNEKCVLITGATGFIGRAVLWKLLSSLHVPIRKIFVLLRTTGSNQRHHVTLEERVRDEIFTDKAFIDLRRSMGPTTFDKIVKTLIHPIAADLSEINIGLSEEDRKTIVKETNIIFHCAGSVDGNERLDHAVKINALGTMKLMEIAEECMALAAFIHLTPLQVQIQKPEPFREDRLLPIADENVDTVVKSILLADLEELPTVFAKFKIQYPNSYLLSKSITEHLIVKRIEKNQNHGCLSFPLSIIRLGPVGPSVSEPLIGWAHGVNSANGTILLTSRGVHGAQAENGDGLADVVPVDLVARTIIGVASVIHPPPASFVLPSIETITATSALTTATHGSTNSSRTSQGSLSSVTRSAISSGMSQGKGITLEMNGRERASSLPFDADNPKEVVFPYIYHLTMSNVQCLSWRIAYEAMTQYMSHATNLSPPPAQAYFSSGFNNAVGLTRARTVMTSIRMAASTYMNNTSASVTGEVPGKITRKRNSHWMNKCVDMAIRAAWTTRPLILQKNPVISNSQFLKLQSILKDSEVDTYAIIPEMPDTDFWLCYFMNASYGMHYFVGVEPDLRLSMPTSRWSCALHSLPSASDSNNSAQLVNNPIPSVVFTADQIAKRTRRMVTYLKSTLMGDTTQQNEKQYDEWLNDLDDSLDDCCHDSSTGPTDKEKRMVLGKWRKAVGGNDDIIKVNVLNDKRVNQAIHQITQNAGVQKQTAMNEAIKILMRMSERTQLAFVWFASHLMKRLFDDMFEGIRLHKDSIRQVRDATLGKRVVYVPVSKSVLDPLLVWFITIRYHLPVPSFACDEALTQLGPISDIYRLAGAYYIKRDRTRRSPLNNAVTAAYTQVLLREYGALSITLERMRTRTGKNQAYYNDGLVDMIVESTLQSNQSRTSSISRSSDASLPENSQSSASVPTSPTTSLDQYTGYARKTNRDVVFVPIHITYENTPELPNLIDQVIGQQVNRQQSTRPTPIQGVVRPSEAHDKRIKVAESPDAQRKLGRVLVGVGIPVSVQDVAEECYQKNNRADDALVIQAIVNKIQTSQRDAAVISPVSLVAAIILYGRATGGVSFGKIKDIMEWLRAELYQRSVQVDWQEGEDINAVVLYAFRMLDDAKNIVVDGKDMSDDTNIRVNDHTDNVMAIAYYANQIVNAFLLDSLFAVVYLSFIDDKVTVDEFSDRFRFLVQMLEHELVISWDIQKELDSAIVSFENRKIIKRCDDGHFFMCVNVESGTVRYEQLMFLASLIYPTIDSYWITSCSLSALEAIPMIPRSIVPLLTQWIAAHLITGRRTIYREVLSTESSWMATNTFITLGFLTEVRAQERLSPDAQILLHELGIPTSEILICLSSDETNDPDTPVGNPEDVMKAVLARIQMNRANTNMADLCQQINSYRLGAVSQREAFQNKLVFQKCLKQIRGILQPSSSFAKKRHANLVEHEDGLVQLVYTLRASGSSSLNPSDQGRPQRRVSEAYNLGH